MDNFCIQNEEYYRGNNGGSRSIRSGVALMLKADQQLSPKQPVSGRLRFRRRNYCNTTGIDFTRWYVRVPADTQPNDGVLFIEILFFRLVQN